MAKSKHQLQLSLLIQGMMVAIWVTLILGQLLRWQVSSNIAVYPHDLLAVMLLVWLGWCHRRDWWRVVRQLSPKHYPLALIWLGIVLLGLNLAVLSGHSILTASLYLSRIVVYAICLGLSTWYVGLKPFWLWLGWVTVGIGVAYLGVWQYVLIPDTRFLSILGWDDHYYRLVSTWLDPTFTGLVVAASAISLTAWQPIRKQWRQARDVIVILLGSVVALTFSRSSYLALAVGWVGTWWWLPKAERKMWIVTAVIWAASVWWAPKPTGEGVVLTRTSTIVARQGIWEQSLTSLVGLQNVVGRGVFVPLPVVPGTESNAVADHGRQADNSLLFSIMSFGWVGAAVWWVMLAQLGWFWWHRDKVGSVIGAMWLLHSLFSNSLWQPFTFLSLGGLLLSHYRLEQQSVKNGS